MCWSVVSRPLSVANDDGQRTNTSTFIRFGHRLRFFELLSEFVPLAARGVEVEHQVLDVQPQLRESLLNESQNPASTTNRIDDSIVRNFQITLHIGRQSRDVAGQLDQFTGQLLTLVVWKSRMQSHRAP